MAGYFRKTMPPSSQWAGVLARLEPIRTLVAAIRAYPHDNRSVLDMFRNPAPQPDPKLRAAIRAAFPPADAALGDILRSPLMFGVPVDVGNGYSLDLGEFTKVMFLARSDIVHANLPLAGALHAFCVFVERHAATAQEAQPQAPGQSRSQPVTPKTDPLTAEQPVRPAAPPVGEGEVSGDTVSANELPVQSAVPLAPYMVVDGGVRFRLEDGEYGPLCPLDNDGDPLKALAELLRAHQAGETPGLKSVVSNPSAAVTKAVKLVPGLKSYISRPGRAGDEEAESG